jgi:ABC-type ATPase with predicted acetyltransferase domain
MESMLNMFLSDITNGDATMLYDIKSTFGRVIKGDKVAVIQLTGSSNGKTTFLKLLKKVMGDSMVYCSRDGTEDEKVTLCVYEDIDSFNDCRKKQNVIICNNHRLCNDELKTYEFKTQYVDQYRKMNQKIKDCNFTKELLNEEGVVDSFLEFLIQ